MKCKYNKQKECPYKYQISGAGILHVRADRILGCCKSQRQLEVLKKIKVEKNSD